MFFLLWYTSGNDKAGRPGHGIHLYRKKLYTKMITEENGSENV